MTNFFENARILLVRTDRLGDVILSLPLAIAIKEKFPHARVDFLCRRYTAPAPIMCPYVDKTFCKERSSVRAILQKQEYDVTILIHPSLSDAIFLFRLGIKTRIGTAYRLYSFLFNHRIKEHRKDSKFHEITYNLHLLKPLGIHCDWREPKIVVPDYAKGKGLAFIEKFGLKSKDFVIVHPGSGGSALGWKPAQFHKLVQIIRSKGVNVAVTAGPGEREVAEYVAGCSPIISGLNLFYLSGVISQANLLVANSTGILHLADAIGIPTLGIFPVLRQASQARWRPARGVPISPNLPLCKRCSKKCDCYPCTDLVKPEDVARKILEMQN